LLFEITFGIAVWKQIRPLLLCCLKNIGYRCLETNPPFAPLPFEITLGIAVRKQICPLLLCYLKLYFFIAVSFAP